MLNREFWEGKKVFLTGHTGFKGTWLSILLQSLGAQVAGYALENKSDRSLFEMVKGSQFMNSNIGDIRDVERLTKTVQNVDPDMVIHMAAQPLVHESYINPVQTYEVNVIGTVNVLEAVRQSKNVRAVINVTTDKVYENKEWIWGYREEDVLGGHDPYSSSKSCSEIVTNAYRNSFFSMNQQISVATARAGNVIGGGDWASDRLIPDILRSILNNKTITIRSPHSIRPWQYVLEPLAGYLLLGEKLYKEGSPYEGAWNFGPNNIDSKSVQWIMDYINSNWKSKISYEISDQKNAFHETNTLKLDNSKAKSHLNWEPKWSTEKSLFLIEEWFEVYKNRGDIHNICMEQINEYMNS